MARQRSSHDKQGGQGAQLDTLDGPIWVRKNSKVVSVTQLSPSIEFLKYYCHPLLKALACSFCFSGACIEFLVTHNTLVPTPPPTLTPLLDRHKVYVACNSKKAAQKLTDWLRVEVREVLDSVGIDEEEVSARWVG